MISPTRPAQLPAPPAEAAALSEKLRRLIAAEIGRSGWLSFARYMELALYAPGLGYYMAGARKLGRDGDFVTAPEISRLYGRTLARQVGQLAELGFNEILEIGAGSGALAADLLTELERLGRAPERYLILELSPDLRDRSRDTLAARAPHLLERVAWLSRLPPSFTGIVIGNEVLDAMPAHVFQREGGSIWNWGWRSGTETSSGPRDRRCSRLMLWIHRAFRRTVTAAKSSSLRAPLSRAWAPPWRAARLYSSITASRAMSITTCSVPAAR